MSCSVLLRLAIPSDDADYDAGETFGNVPLPRYNFGNDHAYNGLQTRWDLIPRNLSDNLFAKGVIERLFASLVVGGGGYVSYAENFCSYRSSILQPMAVPKLGCYVEPYQESWKPCMVSTCIPNHKALNRPAYPANIWLISFFLAILIMLAVCVLVAGLWRGSFAMRAGYQRYTGSGISSNLHPTIRQSRAFSTTWLLNKLVPSKLGGYQRAPGRLELSGDGFIGFSNYSAYGGCEGTSSAGHGEIDLTRGLVGVLTPGRLEPTVKSGQSGVVRLDLTGSGVSKEPGVMYVTEASQMTGHVNQTSDRRQRLEPSSTLANALVPAPELSLNVAAKAQGQSIHSPYLPNLAANPAPIPTTIEIPFSALPYKMLEDNFLEEL
ncbi:unnamed protein product [Protopolystoma xenopodis]|uniref:Uncharacterized protein n=1 Tax=Protopolystoma xenopodis TaxID=117903 RepID=A0A3S5B627_9PLAT|nr:unnamed protein product [Protopolystoma xenopodis]